MRLKLLVFVFFTTIVTFAQQIQLSQKAEISVITVGPGLFLNDAFGHSAFRVTDRSKGIDAVYGYGTYDFEAPNFYLKFAQGKLNYLISRHNYSDFKNYYISSNRTIKEQTLNFSLKEKQTLFNNLENNYKPKNRKYLYDFFYDNCATRIRDNTIKASTNNIDFNLPKNFEPKTFRTLIHDHVDLNTWGSFGIDIALGSVIDRKASIYEHMFLPEYVHTLYSKATTQNDKKLVKSETTIYTKKETASSFNFLFSPLMVMGLLGLFILYITYKDYKTNTRSKWLDLATFFITGLIGISVLLLWTATDHTATAHNYNLLWAFPLNIFVIGQLLRPQIKNWFKGYLKLLIIMLTLMTLHWLIGVQVFTVGLIPLLIALVLRYVFLVKFFNQK